VWALKETHKRWKHALEIVAQGLNRSMCDGRFRRIHGRPCLHELMAIIDSEGSQKLEPSHFDLHWWPPSAKHTAQARILEPVPRRRRQKSLTNSVPHRAGYGVSSTRRDPSGFEIIEDH
ncbi:hypothetical protein PHMEG_00036394, partial [Phytophthora megakarya]